jgi:hypothetical protein
VISVLKLGEARSGHIRRNRNVESKTSKNRDIKSCLVCSILFYNFMLLMLRPLTCNYFFSPFIPYALVLSLQCLLSFKSAPPPCPPHRRSISHLQTYLLLFSHQPCSSSH